jgi:hypothetical protein
MALGTLAGCGDDKQDARDQVRAYLKDVNRIERTAAPDVKRANKAYTRFARGKLKPEDAASELKRSDIEIRDVRDRLAALDAPERARPLHRKLVALYTGVARFTQQSAVLANYQWGADVALEPVARYNRDLRKGLGRAESASAQARLLDRFSRRIAGVVRDLRNLQAPQVLNVSHEDQIRRLDATRRLAARLRQALREGDAPLIARLVGRFSGQPGGGPREGLARKAIAEYNNRYRELNQSYGDVYREYRRLDRATS